MKKKAQEKYWFPAKRYGYGWGLPNAWQGRLVFLGYLAAVLLSCVFLERREIPSWFFPLHIFLLALFVFIVWKKGETPKWRWGEQEQQHKHEQQ